MKKTVFSVAMAFAAGLFVSCTAAAPKADLNGASKADSLAYAIGVAQTQGLQDYLVGRMGVDTTYMGQFVNGVLDGVNADDQQNAYYAGTQIGQQVVNQIIPGVTGELFGDKEGELNKKYFTTAFIAGVTEKGMKMTPAEAQEKAMSLMTAIKENNDSTANLKAEIDTFSYAMGLAQTQGLKGFIMYRMGVDTTYMADFVKGLKTGIKAGDNAKQTAFYTGIQIGQQVDNQIIPGVSREVYGNAEELINKDFFLSGFIAGVTGKNLSMKPMEAQMTARISLPVGSLRSMKHTIISSIAGAEYCSTVAVPALDSSMVAK